MLRLKGALFVVLLSLFMISLIQTISADVFINEIMYNPSQGNDFYNEWIEILNSGNDVNLLNFTLCGKTLLPGYVDRSGNIHKDEGLILEENSYALITDGGTGTEVYDNFNVSDNTLALHVNAASLCQGSALSNSGSTITLEKFGEVVDQVTYSNDAREGYSLELINEDFVESQILSGTPGRENGGSGGGGGGAVCGDGIVQQGEACDAGSANGACPATCSSSCTINSCDSGGGSGDNRTRQERRNETRSGGSGNTTTGQTQQGSTTSATATILEKPTSMKFGEIKIVKAKFLSDADYEKLLFLLYSAPKRVVREFDGGEITQNKIDATTVVNARAYKNQEIEFSLPLKLADNCNSYYEDGQYEILLRAFYQNTEWKSLGDLASFSLATEYNQDLCTAAENSGTKQNTEQITGQTSNIRLYFSESKIIKNIGLWILIALTILLLILIWKKKLI